MSTTLGRGEEVDVIKTLLHLQLCQDVLRNLTNAKVLCELYSCALHLIDQGGGKKKYLMIIVQHQIGIVKNCILHCQKLSILS